MLKDLFLTHGIETMNKVMPVKNTRKKRFIGSLKTTSAVLIKERAFSFRHRKAINSLNVIQIAVRKSNVTSAYWE